jgi:FixJ family two-component response regulator
VAPSADKVLVLDDDPDLLDSLSDTIRVLAHKTPVSARSYEDLVAQRDSALECSMALLDINLGMGKPSGLDAYDFLRREGFKGEITFLTGHARTHPVVAWAHSRGHAHILQKPLSADELLRAIEARGS